MEPTGCALDILYADMANALKFEGTADSDAEIRLAALGINWKSLGVSSLRGNRLGVGVGLQALSHDGLFGGQIQKRANGENDILVW